MKYFAWLLSLLACLFLFSCSSAPPDNAPAWIHSPTRVVDNGWIVYTGSSSASSPERASFRAEGMALEDLANECSMIPNGTRVEDRYLKAGEHETTAYVKIGVELQECDEMRKAIDPDKIKKLGNIAFTEQLKRYQDLNETGEMPGPGEVTEMTPPEKPDAAPTPDPGWNETTHFYVTRQYIAYQKEIVVLSPPNAYPPGSPQSQNFISAVQPASQRVETMITEHPLLRTAPVAWSKLPDRPHYSRPAQLAPPRRVYSRPVVAPPRPGSPHAPRASSRRGGKRRHHQHW